MRIYVGQTAENGYAFPDNFVFMSTSSDEKVIYIHNSLSSMIILALGMRKYQPPSCRTGYKKVTP